MSEILSHISTVSSVTMVEGDFIFKERQKDRKLILLFASGLETDPKVPELVYARDLMTAPMSYNKESDEFAIEDGMLLSYRGSSGTANEFDLLSLARFSKREKEKDENL